MVVGGASGDRGLAQQQQQQLAPHPHAADHPSLSTSSSLSADGTSLTYTYFPPNHADHDVNQQTAQQQRPSHSPARGALSALLARHDNNNNSNHTTGPTSASAAGMVQPTAATPLPALPTQSNAAKMGSAHIASSPPVSSSFMAGSMLMGQSLGLTLGSSLITLPHHLHHMPPSHVRATATAYSPLFEDNWYCITNRMMLMVVDANEKQQQQHQASQDSRFHPASSLIRTLRALQVGPLSRASLQALLRSGQIDASDSLVWHSRLTHAHVNMNLTSGSVTARARKESMAGTNPQTHNGALGWVAAACVPMLHTVRPQQARLDGMSGRSMHASPVRARRSRRRTQKHAGEADDADDMEATNTNGQALDSKPWDPASDASFRRLLQHALVLTEIIEREREFMNHLQWMQHVASAANDDSAESDSEQDPKERSLFIQLLIQLSPLLSALHQAHHRFLTLLLPQQRALTDHIRHILTNGPDLAVLSSSASLLLLSPFLACLPLQIPQRSSAALETVMCCEAKVNESDGDGMDGRNNQKSETQHTHYPELGKSIIRDSNMPSSTASDSYNYYAYTFLLTRLMCEHRIFPIGNTEKTTDNKQHGDDDDDLKLQQTDAIRYSVFNHSNEPSSPSQHVHSEDLTSTLVTVAQAAMDVEVCVYRSAIHGRQEKLDAALAALQNTNDDSTLQNDVDLSACLSPSSPTDSAPVHVWDDSESPNNESESTSELSQLLAQRQGHENALTPTQQSCLLRPIAHLALLVASLQQLLTLHALSKSPASSIHSTACSDMVASDPTVAPESELESWSSSLHACRFLLSHYVHEEHVRVARMELEYIERVLFGASVDQTIVRGKIRHHRWPSRRFIRIGILGINVSGLKQAKLPPGLASPIVAPRAQPNQMHSNNMNTPSFIFMHWLLFNDLLLCGRSTDAAPVPNAAASWSTPDPSTLSYQQAWIIDQHVQIRDLSCSSGGMSIGSGGNGQHGSAGHAIATHVTVRRTWSARDSNNNAAPCMAASDQQQQTPGHAFEIRNGNGQTLVLHARSDSEKQEWMTALNACINRARSSNMPPSPAVYPSLPASMSHELKELLSSESSLTPCCLTSPITRCSCCRLFILPAHRRAVWCQQCQHQVCRTCAAVAHMANRAAEGGGSMMDEIMSPRPTDLDETLCSNSLLHNRLPSVTEPQCSDGDDPAAYEDESLAELEELWCVSPDVVSFCLHCQPPRCVWPDLTCASPSVDVGKGDGAWRGVGSVESPLANRQRLAIPDIRRSLSSRDSTGREVVKAVLSSGRIVNVWTDEHPINHAYPQTGATPGSTPTPYRHDISARTSLSTRSSTSTSRSVSIGIHGGVASPSSLSTDGMSTGRPSTSSTVPPSAASSVMASPRVGCWVGMHPCATPASPASPHSPAHGVTAAHQRMPLHLNVPPAAASPAASPSPNTGVSLLAPGSRVADAMSPSAKPAAGIGSLSLSLAALQQASRGHASSTGSGSQSVAGSVGNDGLPCTTPGGCARVLGTGRTSPSLFVPALPAHIEGGTERHSSDSSQSSVSRTSIGRSVPATPQAGIRRVDPTTPTTPLSFPLSPAPTPSRALRFFPTPSNHGSSVFSGLGLGGGGGSGSAASSMDPPFPRWYLHLKWTVTIPRAREVDEKGKSKYTVYEVQLKATHPTGPGPVSTPAISVSSPRCSSPIRMHSPSPPSSTPAPSLSPAAMDAFPPSWSHGCYIQAELSKRYSEFQSFDVQLRKHRKSRGLALGNLPHLPSPTLFGQFSPTLIEERRQAFEAYLSTMLNLREEYGYGYGYGGATATSSTLHSSNSNNTGAAPTPTMTSATLSPSSSPSASASSSSSFPFDVPTRTGLLLFLLHQAHITLNATQTEA